MFGRALAPWLFLAWSLGALLPPDICLCRGGCEDPHTNQTIQTLPGGGVMRDQEGKNRARWMTILVGKIDWSAMGDATPPYFSDGGCRLLQTACNMQKQKKKAERPISMEVPVLTSFLSLFVPSHPP